MILLANERQLRACVKLIGVCLSEEGRTRSIRIPCSPAVSSNYGLVYKTTRKTQRRKLIIIKSTSHLHPLDLDSMLLISLGQPRKM